MKRLFKVTYATSVGRVGTAIVEFYELSAVGDHIRTLSGRILDCTELKY